MSAVDSQSDTPMPSVRLVLPAPGGAQDEDVTDVCDGLRHALRLGEVAVVVCDVARISAPNLADLDALARLRLVARRGGCDMRLRHASAELRDLLLCFGLAEVLPCEEPSGLETRRQPEGREEASGVEEEGDPADSFP